MKIDILLDVKTLLGEGQHQVVNRPILTQRGFREVVWTVLEVLTPMREVKEPA